MDTDTDDDLVYDLVVPAGVETPIAHPTLAGAVAAGREGDQEAKAGWYIVRRRRSQDRADGQVVDPSSYD